MQQDQRSKLNRLLDQGLALPREQRLAWADALGDEHAAIKPRLRALLERSCQTEANEFMRTLPQVEHTDQAGLAHFPGTTHSAGSDVGPYRLLRCLGVGAMGVVWQATRRGPGAPSYVALKFAHVAERRPDLLARLAREQQLLAALDHPNIARSYDAGVTGQGQPYIVLEYVEGQALHEYCSRQQLDLVQRLTLFLQIVQAVAHAHERQIVHRDLKPANVLVSETGTVRLLDFGIGKLLNQNLPHDLQLSSMTGQPLTPAYASPEQLLGAPAGFASDIYSLGVVLYELLTGVRPYSYRRGSNRALRAAILETPPIAPSERSEAGALAAQLRGELDAIVLRALNKLPAERHASAHAFASAIEGALARARLAP